jgi:hypothetical protein
VAARHRGGEQGVEFGESLFDRDELGAPVDQEILPELVAPVHLEHQTAEVAQACLAELKQRATLAAKLSGGGQRAADSTSRGGRRRR